MGWLGRIFDRRDTWARVVLLDLSGFGYLFFGIQPGRPTAGQWVLALLAFAVAAGLFRWPVVQFVTQAGLLVIAFVTLDDPTINQVGASWALAELMVWAAHPRTLALAVVAMAGIYASFKVVGSPAPQTAIFGLIWPIALPVLLGLVVRTSRELALQASRRALAEQQAVRADERAAIARELHDVVAHHVASMVLRVGVARHVLPGLEPRTAEVLDDVHRTGTAALADLRRLVGVLRSPSPVRGDAALTAMEPGALPAALGAAVDRARGAGLIVEASIDPAVGEIDAVRGLAVLRLTQEALTNVAKHAGTSAVAQLSVSVSGGAVSWEVADDGGAGAGGGQGPAGVPGGGGDGLGLLSGGGGARLGGRPDGLSGGGGHGLAGLSGGRGHELAGLSDGGGLGLGGRPGGGGDELGGLPDGGGHGLAGMRERVELLGGALIAGPAGGGWCVRTVLPAPAEAGT
ncbi:two-component sensor histidine kinase [Actinoplanes sp. TBRC 11911]|uniref:sensor histidine kinase n=1 Tax=Actinoplanes sp. TBRC 11911 TaxID=2729386 RepID=UPI00145C8E6F|nr:histidine kinase [Actinoplanes sp. TBRC 11911]NMO51106.1 two-component sensor histidine kinase [Actinoplanes sp. TBRC 11911]